MPLMTLHKYEDHTVRIKTMNQLIWVSMTDLDELTKYNFLKWFNLKSTQKWYTVLQEIGSTKWPIETRSENREDLAEHLRGKWATKEVAIAYTQWYDPKIQIWLWEIIDELLLNNYKETLQPESVKELKMNAKFRKLESQNEEILSILKGLTE